MEWINLKALDQVEEIRKASAKKPVLIFKYSSRCNISRMVLDRLERKWNIREMPDIKSYFLDLISYRDLSNKLAELFKVEHESPQILIIENGEAILNLSHYEIEFERIKAAIKS